MKKVVQIASSLTLVVAVGCATLLGLPDEQTEQFYRSGAKIQKEQINRNMTASTGAKVSAGEKADIRVLPIVYTYTTYNTLKQNEEAYYTSRYTNHSWFRDFMMTAHNEVVKQLKNRGLEGQYYNKDLASLANGKDAEQVWRTGESRRGTPIRVAAFNANPETNFALVNRNNLRGYAAPSDKGVILAMFDVDWNPSTANRLNGDIVLNSAVTMGFSMILCGADACSEVAVPFAKGITASLPMPNKNTIDSDGLKKNQALIQELHGEQIKQLIAAGFERLDEQGVFTK